MSPTPHPSRRRLAAGVLSVLLVLTTDALTGAAGGLGAPAVGPVTVTTSSVRANDGRTYTVTNHLTRDARRSPVRRKWLLVWAGDTGPDATGSAAATGSGHHAAATGPEGQGPDFLAVVDATKGSPSYGRVVNTATLDPLRANEPHHLQYAWHKGDKVYAGGILSDTTYVFDVARLPEVRLSGVNTAGDTPCGSVPDAYAVLKDGTAYGTYMGGPDITGPCRYTNGQVRVGNGYAGSPGEIVRIGPDGRTLSEAPAMAAAGESTAWCPNRPALPKATCANPHGIAVREDLNRMVVSDFAEIRNYLDKPDGEFDPYLIRNTVRIFDISKRNDPRLVSVTHMPTGPREEQLPVFEEEKLFMETAVANQRRNRGAFASTMWGGAVFYTPDITARTPAWREVFDDTTAYRRFDTSGLLSGAGDGGSWLQLSPDDRFLFHTVMGVQLGGDRDITSGMVYVLDVGRLMAAGKDPRCRIDTTPEITGGGAEADCPALVDVLPIRDVTNGGPHWAAMDTFAQSGRRGVYRETGKVERIATANYFLARLGGDGDHRVCMVDVARSGHLSLDPSFRDENTGAECVNFNRQVWPHGAYGDARPHGVLFAVADEDIRGGRP
ncbi:hypothetical protein O7602_09970 [Micromonospora sp. WMMD1128]|uniref:hypothetical protein n=1 Tax=Micromonospora sp. WMMD1128 TaxID=3015150 RepID=UPI00248ADD26|nr:hypothetical protein [Micromonospora sp. WMMD1128]WBB75804.1 hypothetical protein O7602_09970 [Micromonospora sp. WMMD1128]